MAAVGLHKIPLCSSRYCECYGTFKSIYITLYLSPIVAKIACAVIHTLLVGNYNLFAFESHCPWQVWQVYKWARPCILNRPGIPMLNFVVHMTRICAGSARNVLNGRETVTVEEDGVLVSKTVDDQPVDMY